MSLLGHLRAAEETAEVMTNRSRRLTELAEAVAALVAAPDTDADQKVRLVRATLDAYGFGRE